MEITLEILKQIIGDKECQIVLLRREIEHMHQHIAQLSAKVVDDEPDGSALRHAASE